MAAGWRVGCWVKRSMLLGREEECLANELLLYDTYDSDHGGTSAACLTDG